MRGLLPCSSPSLIPSNPDWSSGSTCLLLCGDLRRLSPGRLCCSSKRSLAKSGCCVSAVAPAASWPLPPQSRAPTWSSQVSPRAQLIPPQEGCPSLGLLLRPAFLTLRCRPTPAGLVRGPPVVPFVLALGNMPASDSYVRDPLPYPQLCRLLLGPELQPAPVQIRLVQHQNPFT